MKSCESSLFEHLPSMSLECSKHFDCVHHLLRHCYMLLIYTCLQNVSSQTQQAMDTDWASNAKCHEASSMMTLGNYHMDGVLSPCNKILNTIRLNVKDAQASHWDNTECMPIICSMHFYTLRLSLHFLSIIPNSSNISPLTLTMVRTKEPWATTPVILVQS